jgi:hypothetical protein
MGGITRTLFGSPSKQSSRQQSQSEGFQQSQSSSAALARDMTPSQFTGMRGDIAGGLQGLIGSGGGAQFNQPFTAGVTGNENQLLQQIMGQATQGGPNLGASQDLLGQILSGQQMGTGPAFNPLMDVQGIQGGVAQGEMNPFLQQAIEAAQRPLVENFQDIVAPALRAQFTQAGQQIAGQGSSPFHMAAARAQSGLANAMGDIGTNMAFQDFAQRQALGSQEFQQLRDLMTGQELAGRGMQSQEHQQDRSRQLDAVAQSQGVERAQFEQLLAGLEAQALPRLVEQYGIDQGLEEFRRREQQLLAALQMAGGLAAPTPVTDSVSQGTSVGRQTATSSGSSSGVGGTQGIIPGAINSFMGGFGSFLGR